MLVGILNGRLCLTSFLVLDTICVYTSICIGGNQTQWKNTWILINIIFFPYQHYKFNGHMYVKRHYYKLVLTYTTDLNEKTTLVVVLIGSRLWLIQPAGIDRTYYWIMDCNLIFLRTIHTYVHYIVQGSHGSLKTLNSLEFILAPWTLEIAWNVFV